MADKMPEFDGKNLQAYQTDMLPVYAPELLRQAELAAGRAYAPYSHFSVGAALLLAGGEITLGCNIENASYGATVCAERVAIWSAVAKGLLSPDMPPLALAVTAQPCALCLQVMAEFAKPDFPIILPAEADFGSYENSYQVWRLSDLLPRVFRL